MLTTPSGLPIRALQYWGVVQGAAAQRLTTQQTWQAIRDAAAANGMDSPGIGLMSVNKLRAAANDVRNSSIRFNTALDDYTLTGDMIGLTPYARSLAERNAAPEIHAKVLHSTMNIATGEINEDWRIVRFTGALPSGVGEMRTLIEQDMQMLAEKYNSTHVGVSSIELLEV